MSCTTKQTHDWQLVSVTRDGLTRHFKCHDCGDEVYWGIGPDEAVGSQVPVTTDNPLAGLLDDPAEEEEGG